MQKLITVIYKWSVTVAALSKSCTVLDNTMTKIVGSNPILDTDVMSASFLSSCHVVLYGWGPCDGPIPGPGYLPNV
jgi:hypothetical protein